MNTKQSEQMLNNVNLNQQNRRVLIVGLGITGMAAAIRLYECGWTPLIIERAPARRKGGYTIVLFEAGQTAAKQLNIINNLIDRSHPDAITYEIDRDGRRHKGAGLSDQPGSPQQILRGDMENALFNGLPDDIEIRYATVPTHINQDNDGADVTLTHTGTNESVIERFELVIGADGMRSTVRNLVFGSHEKYLSPMNYMIGACVLNNPVEDYAIHEGLTMAEPGRSMWVFGFGNHNPTVLFSYRTDDIEAQFKGRPIDALRKAYKPKPDDKVLNQALAEFENANEFLFDSVHQVHIDKWHKGRVVLVGDSAWCLTLYSGMGASAGLIGADQLGNMLGAYPDDIEKALSSWESKLRPFIEEHQSRAFKMRIIFTPHNKLQWFLRNIFIRLITNPLLSKILPAPTGHTSANLLKTEA